ncbi:MAG: hypothetical protein L3K03_01000 [Thermoplasmata archaeon]|nr:hypothetical protein [Thermoplasmata archaeon]
MSDRIHLVDAAVARPLRRLHGFAVEGVDEDVLTLAVEATAHLGPLPTVEASPRAIARIRLVGEFGPEAEKILPIALGLPGTPVDREPVGTGGIEHVLQRFASLDQGELLLLAEPSRWSSAGIPRTGAVGIAVWFHPEGLVSMGVNVPTTSGAVPSAPVPGSPVLSLERLFAAMTSLPPEITGAMPGHATWDPSRAPVAPELPEPPTRLPIDLSQLSEGAYVPGPRYWENAAARWRFAADECSSCGSVTFPPKGQCRSCRDRGHLRRIELPSEGVVETVTTVHAGAQPSEFDGPVEVGGAYDVVLVRLTPSIRVPLQVTDAIPGTLRIGDRAGTVWRRLYPMEGEWRYGRKATPLRTTRTPPPGAGR